MPTQRLGPLDVHLVTSSDSPVKTDGKGATLEPLLIVLMHGFGAPGDDLVGLTSSLMRGAGTVLVFPEAPLALRDVLHEPTFGDARAWWPIDVLSMERALARGELRDLSQQIPDGLTEARRAVVATLDALAERYPRHRLVIGGFSQGAMLALDVALHDPRPLAGIVLLSGTLLAEPEWSPRFASRARVPLFQSHGRGDVVLPFALAERLAEALATAGLPVTFAPFDGPHTIPRATLNQLGQWLAAR